VFSLGGLSMCAVSAPLVLLQKSEGVYVYMANLETPVVGI